MKEITCEQCGEIIQMEFSNNPMNSILCRECREITEFLSKNDVPLSVEEFNNLTPSLNN